MHKSSIFEFKEVCKKTHYKEASFLFDLLKNRRFSISHQKMPSFEDHLKFIANHPYYKWLIVYKDEFPIGSIYINSDNSVSIQMIKNKWNLVNVVLKEFELIFTPQEEIKSFRAKKFFFNIHPEDKFMINLLEANGYKISQISLSKT